MQSTNGSIHYIFSPRYIIFHQSNFLMIDYVGQFLTNKLGRGQKSVSEQKQNSLREYRFTKTMM